MKSSKTSSLLILGLTLALSGCKKYVEGDNVNINPNASSVPTLKTLLPAIEDATATNHYTVAYSTTLFAQQMGAYTSGPINDDRHNDVRVAAFNNLYQNGMTNAKLMIDLASAQSSPYYSAIGKILMVINLSLATDLYGDVPFSKAFRAPEIIYPKYDAQQGLYDLMQQYLDQAIAEAGGANTSAVVPAGDDLIFGGAMASWIQTAWFMKARLYMHLTKRGATAAATSALNALANAYTATSRDCQLTYNTRNLNPWNANIAKRVRTGNFFIAPSKRFTDVMNGTTYPGLVDPRISRLMDKRTAANYVGLTNGVGTGNTVDLTEDTYYGKDITPLFICTYAEQKLMEAEARFIAAGGGVTTVGGTVDAYNAYLAGITAHMNKVGVDAAARTTYLASPLVSVTAAGLRLEHILKEKQIALYLHPEAWVDVRRYDYNPAIFRGMVLPTNQAVAMGGQWIRRPGLPNEELSRNPNARAVIKPLTEKMWWDQ